MRQGSSRNSEDASSRLTVWAGSRPRVVIQRDIQQVKHKCYGIPFHGDVEVSSKSRSFKFGITDFIEQYSCNRLYGVSRAIGRVIVDVQHALRSLPIQVHADLKMPIEVAQAQQVAGLRGDADPLHRCVWLIEFLSPPDELLEVASERCVEFYGPPVSID